MNNRKKALVRLIVSLAVIVIGASCVVVCYALHAGQERKVFSVKSNNGLTEKVYLKTNGDVVVLSRSPKMRMITEQDNFFTLHEESILYKDTADTRCVGFAIQHDILSGFAIHQHFRCEQFPVVLDLQSNTIYYQDLQSANIFVANNFHLMRNERLAKTDSKS